MKKKPPVLIITRHRSYRLNYVLDWVFNERLGVSYQLLTSEEAESFQTISITYGVSRQNVVLAMADSPVLEDGWFPSSPPAIVHCEGLPVPIFTAGQATGAFPDIFAAIFWALSRMEEYSEKRDNHGRFPARASWAHRHGLLEVPWVDQWVIRIADRLGIATPLCTVPIRPSFDIDDAYAFRGRGWRSVAGLAVDLVKGRWQLLRCRISWLTGRKGDPFDRYEMMDHLIRDLRSQVLFFLLVADPGDVHDHNIPPGSVAMKDLAKRLGSAYLTGLHPGYGALEAPGNIAREKTVLGKLTGCPVTVSRFHYLRFRLPGSYRALLEAGITEDHSMIYPEAAGFRAGTAHSFPWYDLERDSTTGLRIVPYVVMDRTLRDYMKMAPAEALEKVRLLRARCEEVKAPFSWIWHNSTLGELENWEKYLPVLQDLCLSE